MVAPTQIRSPKLAASSDYPGYTDEVYPRVLAVFSRLLARSPSPFYLAPSLVRTVLSERGRCPRNGARKLISRTRYFVDFASRVLIR